MTDDGTAVPWDPAVRSDPGVLIAGVLGDPGLPADVRLATLLAPYLWLDELTSVFGAGGLLLYFDVRGAVRWRPGEDAGAPVPARATVTYPGARAVRALLYGHAEDAIAAVEEAGFRHDRHPEVEVGGEVLHRLGDRDTLRARVTVRMRLVPPS